VRGQKASQHILKAIKGQLLRIKKYTDVFNKLRLQLKEADRPPHLDLITLDQLQLEGSLNAATWEFEAKKAKSLDLLLPVQLDYSGIIIPLLDAFSRKDRALEQLELI